MKATKAILAFLVAVLAVAMIVPSVSAALLTVTNVDVDGVDADSGTAAVTAGDTVPVEVEYMANQNSQGKVEVSAWIQGAKGETEITKVFNKDLVSGTEGNFKFSVKIPSDLDDEDVTRRDLTLIVRVETNDGSQEITRTLKAQRGSYDLDLLLVDMDNTVKTDSTLPINVVVKNRGSWESDDTFVTVSIPELGISKTAFYDDLYPYDNYDNDDDNVDSRERTLFLSIPSGVEAGLYEVHVRAVNDDTETTVVKTVKIVGEEVEGKTLANPASQKFSVGQEVVYDMILVNTGNDIAIYNLVPSESDALSITLSDSVAVVPAGSSKVVKVYTSANREGTYGFSITANSGDFSETAQYTATVEGTSIVGNNNLVVLTIVLAIIFVVLVIILIVLLTRKPEKSEEFGESYY